VEARKNPEANSGLSGHRNLKETQRIWGGGGRERKSIKNPKESLRILKMEGKESEKRKKKLWDMSRLYLIDWDRIKDKAAVLIRPAPIH